MVTRIVFPGVVSICIICSTLAIENMVFQKFLANTCTSSDDDVVHTNTPYHECLKQCETRSECTAVSYMQTTTLCRMNFQRVTPAVCQGYVYSKKADWIQTSSNPCNCPRRKQCGQAGSCLPSECDQLFDPEDGQIFGARYGIGDKVSFRCNPGYIPAANRKRVCLGTGSWSGQNVSCMEDPSCIGYLVSGPSGVEDDQLTESIHFCIVHDCVSLYNSPPDATSARFARLDMQGYVTGAWTAPFDSGNNQYVQVDFLQVKTISGIALQGRYPAFHPNDVQIIQYVTKFKVLLSTDCTAFNVITNNTGADLIFEGNSDATTIIIRYLPKRSIARCVRINPVEWYVWNSLRFDVLGC